MLPVVLLSLSAAAFAQSAAQKSFDELKTLAGAWEGVLAETGSEFDGKAVHLTLRVTSMGNALMHEMKVDGRPDDPITMFYMEDGRLLLTHYCDAGNRPRMVGTPSPDGKSVDFEFLDIAGNPLYHMHHAVFTVLDANHHVEDWTFMQKDKPVKVHLDLRRAGATRAGLQ
jgi:hypothetical protein